MRSNSILTLLLGLLGQPLGSDQHQDSLLTCTFSHPAPFQVDIIPRSAETSKLIHRTVEAGIRE